jgi:hypothetical protein
MNGYAVMKDAPPYRWATGQIRVMNPYRGWIPVVFRNPAEEERLSKVATTQGVGEVEGLLAQDTTRGVFGVHFPPHVARQITDGEEYLTDPMVHVPRASLERVLDTVRNRVLEWALKYGVADGVVADGSVSDDRPRVVIAGSIIDSQVQIAGGDSTMRVINRPLDVASLLALLAELRTALPAFGLSSDARAQIEADVATLESQARSPKPRVDLLRGLSKAVGEGLKAVAGAVAAELAKRFLGM